jgi:hypothetical protein
LLIRNHHFKSKNLTLNNTESKYQKIFLYIKNLSISAIIIFVATLLQTYWSMGQLSDHMSSGCLSCSFFEDAVLMSFFSAVLLSIVFSLPFFFKKTIFTAIAEFLLLIAIWLFLNYSVFVDRESSWSTYDIQSEIYYTVSMSIFPVILLGGLCIIVLHNKEIKAKFILNKK